MWSFAVCLWEILQLSSVRPFAALESDDQVHEELRAMHNGQASLPSRLEKPPMCPKDLYELMCECWKRDASARPSFREIHLFLQRKNLGYSPMWRREVEEDPRLIRHDIAPARRKKLTSDFWKRKDSKKERKKWFKAVMVQLNRCCCYDVPQESEVL